MMHQIKNFSIHLLLGTIGICSLSCSKWTETEPLEIISQNIEEQNPALYARYLEDLRAYKANPHTINMGWFDNSKKIPSSQGDHFSSVPDSLDYLVLEAPLNLVEREINDIASLLNNKGTKVLFEIDFNAIKTTYIVQDVTQVTFQQYLRSEIQTILSQVDRYNYQGVVISYFGRELLHATPQEITEITEEEALFLQLINPWLAANTNKTLFFKGNPQFLINKALLQTVHYIILPTDNAVDVGGLSYALLSSMEDNVPSNKFIVLASMTSYRADEARLGFFADGSRSALSTARWAASLQNGIQIRGIGYKNLPYDYFNATKSYQYSREAIQITNPAIKLN